MNIHLFESAGVQDSLCIRDGMKRLGMGVRELPDMKRVGTEMASAGADGETCTLCRDSWGCGVRVQVSPPYPQVTCAVPWPFGSCGMRRPCHTKPHSVGNEVVTCKAADTIKEEPLTLHERYALAARGTTSGEGR